MAVWVVDDAAATVGVEQTMPLTENERQAAHLVARQFYRNKVSTTHQQLLSVFRDPDLIIRLSNSQVFNVDTSTGEPTYFPTILTFHHSGDEQLLSIARDAVKVVVRDVKNMFVMNNFVRSRRYEVPVFFAQLESPHYSPVPAQIAFGLFLAKDIPSTISVTLDDEKTTVVSFQINEHILIQDPETVWDKYIQMYDRIGQEDRLKEQAEKQRQASTPKKSLPQQRQRTVTANTDTWLPSRWRIIEHIGEGGQGWTYKVRRSDGSDKTLYVLKRLKNKDRIERFNTEITTLQKLDHPGILKIVETSQNSEAPFFISEFCEGRDLGKANLEVKDLLSKLKIFRQACDAVAAAHDAKVLHRDLKPPNIFLRSDESVVIGDFGLCIDLLDAKERATQTSEGVGADRYIAPEVAKGRVSEPQPTCDLYSLGKVLYFILSGRTLLREEYCEGEDDLRTTSAEPGIHFVYELFDKTIQARPEDRFQYAADLVHALDTVIERVQLKAHVLIPGARQHCLFCVVGDYGPQIGVHGGELIYVCNTCGNIQRFSPGPLQKWWMRH